MRHMRVSLAQENWNGGVMGEKVPLAWSTQQGGGGNRSGNRFYTVILATPVILAGSLAPTLVSL